MSKMAYLNMTCFGLKEPPRPCTLLVNAHLPARLTNRMNKVSVSHPRFNSHIDASKKMSFLAIDVSQYAICVHHHHQERKAIRWSRAYITRRSTLRHHQQYHTGFSRTYATLDRKLFRLNSELFSSTLDIVAPNQPCHNLLLCLVYNAFNPTPCYSIIQSARLRSVW